MTVTREDLACRFCRHKVTLHNNIEGCTSGVCACMATPGEGWPRTIAELEVRAIPLGTALTNHRVTDATPVYGWEDFEEDISTDAIPGKWVLTITEDGEEFATIVHRASEQFPIDGAHAEHKRRNARRIVAAMNREAGRA